LLAAWGVGMTEGEFVADLALAQRVQTGQGGPRQVVDYLPWLNIGQAQLNRDDIVSADLGQLNLASAGALKPTAGATTSFTPLITSSDKAMLVSVDKIKGRPDPEGLLAAFAATGERYVLAARLAGPIKTAFPDGPPPAQPNPDNPTAAGADKPAIHLRDSIKPANIVIVADSDLLDDRFWVRGQELFGQRISVPFASNGDLAVNVVDHLSGTTDLISLRGRGRSQRPFELIEAMRRDAEQKFLARERSLQQRLEATEKQIADVQQKKPAGAAASVLLSAEERAALEGFRDELVRTRRELRAVQRDLNKDIEALEAGVKFVNIGLMPIAVGCLGLFSALLRRARRRAPKV
jgi:ABC-type uncharacterized transport system involved in gliding motility auxiliary subunit